MTFRQVTHKASDMLDGLGRVWPLWLVLFGIGLHLELADQAYRHGYEAAREECAVDRSACGWGGR